MAEGRNRARKVTRKAGPLSEFDMVATEQFSNSASKGSDKGGANSNSSKSSQRSDEHKNSDNVKKSQGSSNPSRHGSRGGHGGRGGNRGNDSWDSRGGRGGNHRNVVQSMQGTDLTQRLPSPPRAPKGGPCMVALGGISEIGHNMTVLGYKNRLIVVDCGVLLPSLDEPGVDLILPDSSYMEDKWDRVETLVVTYGYEDHIDAIPWLLKQRANIPIIASRLTLALIQAKTQEHRQRPKVIEVNGTSHIQRGPFDLRFFNVDHSIPECLGIIIKTGAGMVVHTGDMKIDQTPPDGKPTDLPALGRYGDEGIDLFLCESTNATIPGFLGSEAELTPTLRYLIIDVKRRAIVAAFASNVYRMQAVIGAAIKAGRKVASNGRPMIRNMRIVQELGLLTAPEDTIVEMNEAARMAPHKVVLVTTGTQGEPMAVLSRTARREHRQITVRGGDPVILSSSLVPGNEEVVSGVINMLAQIGATVITDKDAKVHTSGHGLAGELLPLYNAARSSNVMPIHGEWRHIRANKELAVSTGVKPENVVLAQSGVVIDLVDGRARVVGQVPVDNLYVDGVTMGDIDAGVLADRAEMREGGLITVTAVIDNRTGRPLEKPRAQACGYSDDAKEVLETVEQAVDDTLFDLANSGESNPYRMAQEVRRRTERVINQKWRCSPMIIPTVVSMSSEAAEEVTDEGIKESHESI